MKGIREGIRIDCRWTIDLMGDEVEFMQEYEYSHVPDVIFFSPQTVLVRVLSADRDSNRWMDTSERIAGPNGIMAQVGNKGKGNERFGCSVVDQTIVIVVKQ